jgi:hypothetical protein
MELLVSGLIISVILGAFAMAIVMRLTRSRCRAPLKRGRVERAIEYGAGILGGMLTLLALLVLSPEVTPGSQEAGLLGITVGMPASAAATWITGELLSGPTQRSWRPMILAFLAAQAGFMVPIMILSWSNQYILSAFADKAVMVNELTNSTGLVTSFVVGGFASAWAYRRWRREVALSP